MVDALNVLISSASRPEAYDLANFICRGEMFGPKQPVILHLWDSPDLRCTIEFLVSELMDSAMPPLEDIRIINDPQTAFENIDVAIMLDSLEFEDVTTFKNRIDQCVGVYKSIGEALEMKGKQTIKVIVAGNPVNINTFIMSRYAPSISKSCFSGLLRVDHNRALVQIAKKLDIAVENVRNVAIWGNAGPTAYVDMAFAQVTKDPGKIKSVVELVDNEHWAKHTLLPYVKSYRKLPPQDVAMLKSKAIVDHVHDLWFGTRNGEWTSMVTYSNGEYGAPADFFCGFPVTIPEGRASPQIVQDLKFDDWATAQFRCTSNELTEARNIILRIPECPTQA